MLIDPHSYLWPHFIVSFPLDMLFSVGIPSLVCEFVVYPFKRGFFCDDESISHPYHEDTITMFTVAFVGITLPLTVVSSIGSMYLSCTCVLYCVRYDLKRYSCACILNFVVHYIVNVMILSSVPV